MKTCLITGTTSGIGSVTATTMARAGYRVVMACRDPSRAFTLAKQITQATGNGEIHVLPCDLASMSSVRNAADAFSGLKLPLDVLINNAGVLCARPQLSADGFEMMFAVNHLGHFLLTRLMLDMLCDNARVVIVASAVHRTGVLDLENVETLKNFSSLKTYARSKLANVMFTFDLARRLSGTGISVNCLHPGVVASNIFPSNSWLSWGGNLIRPFIRSPEQGSAACATLALDDRVARTSGAYFNSNARQANPAARACDRVDQSALWAYSSSVCGLADTL
ncbi:MAG: SDR family oxidoreductase [Proteobacteria bacterium]|nr:SDR family oxidoreductase [Pseudomonadota bacterium]